jgi:hypothetical protein
MNDWKFKQKGKKRKRRKSNEEDTGFNSFLDFVLELFFWLPELILWPFRIIFWIVRGIARLVVEFFNIIH